MSLRFQRRIRLGRFFRLNLSKSGIGVSAGLRGLRIGTGPRGPYASAGLPGTGLSVRSQLGHHRDGDPPHHQAEPGTDAPARIGSVGVILITVILAAVIGLGLLLIASLAKG